MKTKELIENIAKRGVITEKEISLLKRRANSGDNDVSIDKMRKTEKLKAMYHDLKDGRTVFVNNVTIYIGYNRNFTRKYIYFEGVGRSAFKMGLQNLRELCRDIAKSADYEYTIIG